MSVLSQPLLLRFVRTVYRMPVRGRTRLLLLLARMAPRLHDLPVQMTYGGVVHLDLRVAASHALLLGSTWEIGEQQVMRAVVRPGDVVFDVGAHFGVHTVLLSQLAGPAGQVHAFEPNPAILPVLRQTASALDNISLHQIALSDQSGDATLYVPGDHSMASLADWTDGCAGSTVTPTCNVCRLDEFCSEYALPIPDFIKCDIEGGELLVFRGARQTLDRENAPVILFEFNERAARGFGYAAGDALTWLRGLCKPAYRLFQISHDGTAFAITTPCRGVLNLLAVPQERLSSLAHLCG